MNATAMTYIKIGSAVALIGLVALVSCNDQGSEPYTDPPEVVTTPSQACALDSQPSTPADLNVLLGSFCQSVATTIGNQTAEAAGAIDKLHTQIVILHE